MPATDAGTLRKAVFALFLKIIMNIGGLRMNRACDYAKYFIKNGADSAPNTFDGNMKLQKMLVLADMIHIAQYNRPLFKEKILAPENGCVVEEIRLRYKNDYYGLKADSDRFDQKFADEEYKTLNAAIWIFGHVSARELSELNHQYESWKQAYDAGLLHDGSHDKEKSIVDLSAYPGDIAAVKAAVEAYERSQGESHEKEVVNGVTFYYDGLIMTDRLLSELEAFSAVCDEDAYTVCMDGGRLVIY